MKSASAIRSGCLPAAACLIACGCAPLSEIAREEREYREVEYAEQYREFRAHCLAQGRLVVIEARQRIGRNGMPNVGNIYYCT